MGYDMFRVGVDHAQAFDTGDYFRLNVWGMGAVREELLAAGVIKVVRCPDFPSHTDFANVEEYEAAIDAVRIASPGDGPGIPVHKFCSNDGWVVTPLEVSSGIIYATQREPLWRDKLTEDRWREFVTWMEGSTAGFEVW